MVADELGAAFFRCVVFGCRARVRSENSAMFMLTEGFMSTSGKNYDQKKLMLSWDSAAPRRWMFVLLLLLALEHRFLEIPKLSRLGFLKLMHCRRHAGPVLCEATVFSQAHICPFSVSELIFPAFQILNMWEEY